MAHTAMFDVYWKESIRFVVENLSLNEMLLIYP